MTLLDIVGGSDSYNNNNNNNNNNNKDDTQIGSAVNTVEQVGRWWMAS